MKSEIEGIQLGRPRTRSEAQWPNYLTLTWGLWLISSGFSFGYLDSRMQISDVMSGLLLITLCIVTLNSKISWLKWIMASVGLWLTIAPLVFWSKSAAGYANGNLVGSLVVISSVIIPSLLKKDDSMSSVPRGWTYNPSTWNQRIPIIGLAFTGFLLAKYLAAYQLGHIASVWDPFFGDGTKSILKSEISRAFPVSDAGLGAWSYLLDALFGIYGSEHRWRTQPWVVIIFGMMVIPPGITSIILVMLQPIAVDAWCTICLATAVVMLLMIPPAIDEVVATVQFLRESRRQGSSLWKTFWYGSEVFKSRPDDQEARKVKTSGRSISPVPWNLVLSAVLGLWLMVTPTAFSTQNLASDSHHLTGALIVTFAVIAMAQVARSIRLINILLGFTLTIAVWFLPGGTILFRWNTTASCVAIMLLSLPLGKIQDRFGTYDRIIRWFPLIKGNKREYDKGSRAA